MKCWQESNWVGAEDFEGVRRTTWPIEALGKRASMVRTAPSSPALWRRKRAEYIIYYSILVQFIKDYL